MRADRSRRPGLQGRSPPCSSSYSAVGAPTMSISDEHQVRVQLLAELDSLPYEVWLSVEILRSVHRSTTVRRLLVADSTITYLVLVGAVILFVSNRLPIALVAIGVSVSLWATGVLDLNQSLAGFGDPTVIFIAALFVVADCLESTGVTTWMGQTTAGPRRIEQRSCSRRADGDVCVPHRVRHTERVGRRSAAGSGARCDAHAPDLVATADAHGVRGARRVDARPHRCAGERARGRGAGRRRRRRDVLVLLVRDRRRTAPGRHRRDLARLGRRVLPHRNGRVMSRDFGSLARTLWCATTTSRPTRPSTAVGWEWPRSSCRPARR